MNDLSQFITAVRPGDSQAARELLPLVYEELRQLAAQRLAQEQPGQTLSATALVHEAYARLVREGEGPQWDGPHHFFAAAAEAMRRILVDEARRKKAEKRGGGWVRIELNAAEPAAPDPREDLVALDVALTRLEAVDLQAAKLVELRHFAGLTVPEAAQTLGISPRTADRLWAFARAWLHREMTDGLAGGER
ncbi:MAG: ECF-type sigma factor [Gemmataceae bacterium]